MKVFFAESEVAPENVKCRNNGEKLSALTFFFGVFASFYESFPSQRCYQAVFIGRTTLIQIAVASVERACR